ncbi:ribokinase [Roseobacter weihaiensis]|uniref:ribokinase n=1 Tax=Roseobacter weihaiensis TaxID=2763262 RepID=UPI001D0AEC28|nr:ribokinase [Roseobacter sp. H9]
MAIYNLGSINADNVYRVPHLVAPGETLAATALTRGLGGKGANMSVAAARAAARVVHIGAVGSDGRWASDRLMEYGVDTRHIAQVSAPTGHANICVDAAGENAIVLFAGANHAVDDGMIGAALAEASAGDIFVTQNETNGQPYAAQTAQGLGLRVVYAAAPFDAGAVRTVLPFLDLLVLNEVEAAQLTAETGSNLDEMAVADIVVTMGAKGCRWMSQDAGVQDFPALEVTPVDTTGAGDTFTGYLIAGLDRGMPMAQAIDLATQAAALMVTRVGTADVIPDLKEIQDQRLG